MGNVDSTPFVSQTRSMVQAVSGDMEGARRTQENFLRDCPFVSQGTSVVQAIAGDAEEAKETQKYFAKNLSRVVNGIPVVGHVKGAVHYAVGDKKGGKSAMLSATRTTAVIGKGVLEGILGGPDGIAAAENLSGMANAVPLLGHVKGAIQYVAGDKEAAINALRSASRSTVVIGAAVAGGIVCGHVGAIAAARAGGAAVDGVFKRTGSKVREESLTRPNSEEELNPETEPNEADGASEWSMMPASEECTGAGAFDLLIKIRDRAATSSFRTVLEEVLASGEITLQQGEALTALVDQLRNAAREAQKADAANNASRKDSATTVIIDVEGNNNTGYSFLLRSANNSVNPFNGDSPSVLQKLKARLSVRKPSIRKATSEEPNCDESHDGSMAHAANSMEGNPARTISVVFDGKNIKTIARCGNCKKISPIVQLGEVPTDDIINVDDATVFETAASLIMGLGCTCEGPRSEQ